MRFSNNKIMLLWVKTRILTFLDLGGKGDKSSTMTTGRVTASQSWVENKTQDPNVASHPRRQFGCLVPSRLWCLAPSRLWCLAPALSVATLDHGKVGVFQLVSLHMFCVYQVA